MVSFTDEALASTLAARTLRQAKNPYRARDVLGRRSKRTNVSPDFAVRIAAAPMTPIAGKPNFPKIRRYASSVFVEKTTMLMYKESGLLRRAGLRCKVR